MKKDTNGQIKVLPPKTAEEILAGEKERRERTTLLMAIPEDHLAKFHKMTGAKEMWDAIKSRFGDNDKSKKMQKYILKQQFEGFSVSPLKIPIRSSLGLYLLPGPKYPLIMRTKPGVDSLSFDDLYNNLRVFETDVKGSTGSSSSAQNVAFVSSESTSSTNDIDEFNLEEMDLKWQVAMISMILKKFYKKAGRKLQFDAKEPVGFNKTKVECFNCHKTGHFARECKSKGNQDIRRRDAGNTGYKAKDNGRRHAPAYDRFAKVEGMHAVPPQMTGNYMPLKSNFGIDESQFAYGPKQSKTSESDAKTSDFDFCESHSSVKHLNLA
ncbi:ribonuclease H-like domain-containing protein [Tanacetum coccineum]